MIDIYIILFLIVIFIVYKGNLIPKIGFKNVITNLWYIIPIITMYLEKDSISKLLYSPNKKIKRNITSTTKKVVASNQQWYCNMCKNMLDASYEVDHIIPLYKGGNNELYNLQALCRNCHGMKTINDNLNI
jgi:5-methylcytosine-specific restriction enzyme A|tara:strand:- start:91 stop:483 length:393 start_codon:yes stop_codon:yes gene_type:complete